MLRLVTIVLELLNFFLKRGKPKKEKERDKFDEALAENNFDHISDSLSDDLDRVREGKNHNHPEW